MRNAEKIWQLALSPGEKLTLLALDSRCDSNNSVRLRVPALARLTGISQRAVRKHLRSLDLSGFVTRQEIRNPDGGRAANLYHLTLQEGVPGHE